ncbi:MAG: hypothetical protein CO135_01475 [Candidatus Levybacteria bacterium CG_4_9_14_3_um_filter_35_16]|nr:MAG: hypothetical protein COW87_02655 [Candidatus Levybacteria bacterium CG22_combo_CG10-13_8_21_14_all_35_11]PIY94100.1 MAG: hypothetical protein COY68_03710 [Candidatus Levybacteria bacterium CG_4_10_14_0_8_um_filter_35_23]PIZ99385.1 MAG: hypothetical protein COX78_01900 [Candidatus Levybacteria bacterium CG_4_10_14_0_2_um_filter_35_8]PJA91448.1 MAG: hypothetical protein CO135_01475 [Candidatus Levybacteria bacterium CG_4_9_14_3_um_filter_35_16]PJC54520.1 MAG: hypothetical protein CO028_01
MKTENRKQKTENRNFLKSYLLSPIPLLILIILIGAFLRLQGVFSNSFAFTFDVGRDMLALWNIAYNHKITLIGPTTGIPGVFYGPWWYYALVPFFVFFQGDPQGIAFIMSLVGILCIYLAYYAGKKIGNSFLGISMALLVSISPTMISLSSQIWNPNVAPLLVLLTFLVLGKIYVLKDKAKLTHFFCLGIILALNIDVEILWGIFFSLGVTFSLNIILKRNFSIKKITSTILGGLLILFPRILFDLRHEFLMSRSFITFLSTKTLEDKRDLYHFLENRLLTHLDVFAKSFLQGDNFPAILTVIFTVIVISFFYKKASQILREFILTSLIILLVFFVGTLIFSHALWPHYFVGLPVIYIFLFSISVFLVVEKLKSKFFGIMILAIVFIVSIYSQSIIQNIYKPLWEGDASVYRNQLEVIDYAYREANGKPFKYNVYTPPVFDYTYQYLFKWYGPNKYGYSPTQKVNIAFFIIEPDPGYLDRPKWWLEARVNDGIIIKQEKLKGGIVVQTRAVK